MNHKSHYFAMMVVAALAAFSTVPAFAQKGKAQAKEFGYPDTDGTYSYTGPVVRFDKYTKRDKGTHEVQTEYLGKLMGRKGKGYAYQGMDYYNGLILSCQNQGVATVYSFDGKEIQKKGQFELVSFNKINHSNVVSFGTEFYDKSDPLPLAYISHCNRALINGKKDVLYVERIAPDFQSSQLVQAIVYDDVNNDFGYALQWVIDRKNGYLYGFGNTVDNTDPKNCHRIIKFRLPKLSDTDKDGYVILHPSDALENYRIEDVSDFKGNFIGQGLYVSHDKLYLPTGFGTEEFPSILYVWDLRKRKMCNKISLVEGTHSEFEDCTVIGKKKMLIQAQHGLFLLQF
ncbi:MAG: hypothetical protein LKJ95_10980 [Bacteroidales bacterium]|jgi:hypothetical protein|nr:hypothetical protein [Bacteroidales bacterium]